MCFGEVLWDVLPDERIAGGAPMNVAIRLQSLGIQARIISKIGIDPSGKELLQFLQSKGLNTQMIQTDKQLNTGEVHVQINEKGQASYNIIYPSAWDTIKASNSNLQTVAKADALVFGSLACRDTTSRNTLFGLLKVARFKVFDVNLRAPFYSIPLLSELMEQADLIKLNDDELFEITQALGFEGNEKERIQFLGNYTHTENICITRGDCGAIIWTNKVFYEHQGYKVNVADTIGAGDSFLAGLLSQLIHKQAPDKALAFGCALGALVASHKGANPTINEDDIKALLG